MQSNLLDGIRSTRVTRLTVGIAGAAAIVTTLFLSAPAFAGRFTENDGSGPMFGDLAAAGESGSPIAGAVGVQTRLRQDARSENIMTDAAFVGALRQTGEVDMGVGRRDISR